MPVSSQSQQDSVRSLPEKVRNLLGSVTVMLSVLGVVSVGSVGSGRYEVGETSMDTSEQP